MNFLRIFGNKGDLKVNTLSCSSSSIIQFKSYLFEDIKFHDWEVSEELRKRKVEYTMEVLGSKTCNSVETEVCF